MRTFLAVVNCLTFGDNPLYPQFHVTEFNHLSYEIILVPAGRSRRAGPGQEIQSRLEQRHFIQLAAFSPETEGGLLRPQEVSFEISPRFILL